MQIANVPVTTPSGEHVYTPVNVVNGVAKWADKALGIPVGYPILSLSVKEPAKGGSSNYKVLMKIALPVMEVSAPSTATGFQPAPTVAYTAFGTLELTIPARSTAANRTELLAQLIALLSSTVLNDAAIGLNNQY